MCLSLALTSDLCLLFLLLHLLSSDDDLDIFVTTDDDETIDWRNPTNEQTQLELQGDEEPVRGLVHVENIFFNPQIRRGRTRSRKLQSIPDGTYEYGVVVWDQRGDFSDDWELTVTIDGEDVAQHSGSGEALFTYTIGTAPTSFPTTTKEPTETPVTMEPSIKNWRQAAHTTSAVLEDFRTARQGTEPETVVIDYDNDETNDGM